MTNDNQRILLIRTGGTIDAVAYADPINPPKIVTSVAQGDSQVNALVKTLDGAADIDCHMWDKAEEGRFIKDSQEFKADDIQALADIIKADNHRYFILTHGTDDLAKNTQSLKQALGDTDKVVAVAGAMVPLSMTKDGDTNAVKPALQYAVNEITKQPAGVYVIGRNTSNKRLNFFDPTTIEKDYKASRGKQMALTFKARLGGDGEAAKSKNIITQR
jgi:L-asparaginase/Glu-tRNA(Gln) amidotransferase subunit D